MADQAIRLNSFAGGVSTQPPTKRFPNEVSEAINVSLTMERNMEKRAGSQFISSLSPSSSDPADPTADDYKWFFIDRGDDDEEYLLSINGTTGVITVFEAKSGAVLTTVTGDSDQIAYLTAGDVEDLVITSIYDTTLILNPSVEAKFLNTGDGRALTYMDRTDTIAVKNQEMDAKDSNNDYTTQHRSTKANFDFPPPAGAATGANGESDIIGLGEVYLSNDNLFSSDSYDSFYKVVSEEYQPYYVRVRTEMVGSVLDKTTWPIKLFSASPTNWQLSYPDWKPRLAGNPLTNPGPSPIANSANPYATDGTNTGAKIKTMTFSNERLIFASGDVVFSSGTDDVFNLWINSPQDPILNDPFDLKARSNKVTEINSMIPFYEDVFILTGGKTQYLLQIGIGEQKMMPTSFYGSSPEADAFRVGSQLLWLDQSDMYLFIPSTEARESRAVNISKHCDGYLPKAPIRAQAVAEKYDQIFWSTDGSDTTGGAEIYVYQQKWTQESQKQSCFFKWYIKDVERIEFMYTLNDRLWVVAKIEGSPASLHLFSIGLDLISHTDGVTEDLTSWPAMDQFTFVDHGDLSFSTADGNTSMVIEGQHPSVDVCLLGDSGKYIYARKVLSSTPAYNAVSEEWETTVVFEGQASEGVCVGTSMDMRVDMSPVVFKDSNLQFVSGSHSIKTMSTRFYNSGIFDVTVTDVSNPNRTPRVDRFDPYKYSQWPTYAGSPPVVPVGEVLTSVNLNADTASMSLSSSSPWALNITNIEVRNTVRPVSSDGLS